MEQFDKTTSVRLLRIELNLTQPSDDLFQIVPDVWDSFADKALVAPRLQYLYSLRQLLNVLIGRSALSVDVTDDQQEVKLSQQGLNFRAMRKVCDEEISKIEGIANGAIGVLVGAMITANPTVVPNFSPDPNDTAYSGSPIRRRPYFQI
jgi:hypothetical protein